MYDQASYFMNAVMANPTMIFYFFTAVIMVAGMVVQWVLTAKFKKYSKVALPGGLTGAQVAQKMLEENGIHGVKVQATGGMLTDHYDPRTMTVNLSDDVYGTCSIAAAAVAAHECGHAVQHAQGYAPLKLRSALVPAVNFSNRVVQWVLLAGIILVETVPAVLWAGIALFAMCTLFSFVTLPVEINASHRAISWLSRSNVAGAATMPMAQSALRWAAYTYVIAAIGSLATLLYYIVIALRRR